MEERSRSVWPAFDSSRGDTAWTAGVLWMMVILSGYAASVQGGYPSTLLLGNDFNGGQLDPNEWEWWDPTAPRTSGITRLYGCPVVANGMLTLEHHTYNEHDPMHATCLSQEIRSKKFFSCYPSTDHVVEFRARLRVWSPVQSGLVAGFYSYSDKVLPIPEPNRFSDEIDYEFLTSQINSPYPTSMGDRVFVSLYNDFCGAWMDSLSHWRENVNVPQIPLFERPKLDLSKFNVFIFRWLGDRIEWYWDPEDKNGEILIAKTYNIRPDEPMRVGFNLWAADEYWPAAWDAGMRPARVPEEDRVDYLDIDYVRVNAVRPDNCTEAQALGMIQTADVNRDCSVDFGDYAVLAEHWLEGI